MYLLGLLSLHGLYRFKYEAVIIVSTLNLHDMLTKEPCLAFLAQQYDKLLIYMYLIIGYTWYLSWDFCSFQLVAGLKNENASLVTLMKFVFLP